MITGFNTDIEYGGRVFHVQTEDKGLENPIIETLVYTGGQIVTARKTSYAQMLTEGDCQETTIQQRMEAQHRELIRDIQDGELSGAAVQPFGAGVISDLAFDEVVARFLTGSIEIESPKLEWLDRSRPEPGASVRLAVRVTDGISDRPIAGASIVIKHLGPDGISAELGQASTDALGTAAIQCRLPDEVTKKDKIVCEALVGELKKTASKTFKARSKSVQPS